MGTRPNMAEGDAFFRRWFDRWNLFQRLVGEHHDIQHVGDCDDGTPRLALAHSRTRDKLRALRDRRNDPDYDPWDDESLELFPVADVALIFDDLQRLRKFEEDIARALGPPLVGHVWRDGKYVPE
jgi:hypothetical protein